MLMRQYELRSDDGEKLLTWLPTDAKLYEGSRLTLKEYPETVWYVTKRYGLVKRKKAINRNWNVGGVIAASSTG